MKLNVRLSGVRSRRLREGGSRASARVGWRTVWFESPDVELRASVEGFCGAAWLAALKRGRGLTAPHDVDAVWWSNVQELHSQWQDRGDFPRGLPRGVRVVDSAAAPRQRRTALFFSCGADSFYSLFAGPIRPQALVFGHGFDIPLCDRQRGKAAEEAVKSVARELSLEAISLSTNYRAHPILRRANWGQVYGAAMAAAGHALGGEMDQILISTGESSPGHDSSWGADWRTVHLWSSAAVRFVRAGGVDSRLTKTRAIAGHPLVQQRLRVCWQNTGLLENCSRCDKCLCMMAMLEYCGSLRAFCTFDHSESLLDRLDRLPRTGYLANYTELLAQGLDRPLRTAIKRLLSRSPSPAQQRLAAKSVVLRGAQLEGPIGAGVTPPARIATRRVLRSTPS